MIRLRRGDGTHLPIVRVGGVLRPAVHIGLLHHCLGVDPLTALVDLLIEVKPQGGKRFLRFLHLLPHFEQGAKIGKINGLGGTIICAVFLPIEGRHPDVSLHQHQRQGALGRQIVQIYEIGALVLDVIQGFLQGQCGKITVQCLAIGAGIQGVFPVAGIAERCELPGCGFLSAEDHLCTGTAITSQGDIAHGGGHQEEHGAHHHAAKEPSLGLGRPPQAVAQCPCRYGEAGGKALALPCRAEEQMGIVFAAVFVFLQKYRLVTAELQVVGTAGHGHPHQGIKPDQGGTEGHKKLVEAILSSQMHQLMAEDQMQLLRGVVPLGQNNADAAPGKANGEGRLCRGRAHQPVGGHLLSGGASLRFKNGENLRLCDWLRLPQQLTAILKVPRHLPKKHRRKARHPDTPSQRRQPGRNGNHPARHVHAGPVGQRQIEIVGQQPQRGTGAGADDSPEERQKQEQNKLVAAQVQRNGKKVGKHPPSIVTSLSRCEKVSRSQYQEACRQKEAI